MATFAKFCETKPMKDQMLADIEKHAITLCGALYEDLKSNHRRHHSMAINHIDSDTFKGDKEYERAYHIRKIHEIDTTGVNDEFYLESGRKYYKLIHQCTPGGSRSVHAFIDKTNGDVYKSASWKAPAKGVRYNLLDDSSREECYARADWAGGYLYVR
jgi:hypothetical protein